MSTPKTFKKGDAVIKSGVWSSGEGRPEFGPHTPSIYVFGNAKLGAMGKQQGYVVSLTDGVPGREQVYARSLNSGVFHAADEAEAIVFARAELRRTLEARHAFIERSEYEYGAEAARAEQRVADRVWETCPIERREWRW